MFIFSLINILADHQKKKKGKELGSKVLRKITHHTGRPVLKNSYFYFKGVTVISENYNQQSRSLHLGKLQPSNAQSRKKPQVREKEKEGEGEERKEGRRGIA